MIAPHKMSLMIEAFDIMSDLVVIQHQEAESTWQKQDVNDYKFFEADFNDATERMETLLRAIDPYVELCIEYMSKHPEDFSMRDGHYIDRVINAYKYAELLTESEPLAEQAEDKKGGIALGAFCKAVAPGKEAE